MACKDRCEEYSRSLIALLDHNIRVTSTSQAMIRLNRPIWVAVGVFLLVCGAIFIALGLVDDRIRIVVVLGAMFGVFGVLALGLARRLPQLPE